MKKIYLKSIVALSLLTILVSCNKEEIINKVYKNKDHRVSSVSINYLSSQLTKSIDKETVIATTDVDFGDGIILRAELIETNNLDVKSTKAEQEVTKGSFYTFYGHGGPIRKQNLTFPGATSFGVPVEDENYKMLFLANVGNETNLPESEKVGDLPDVKEFKLTATTGEDNLCYQYFSSTNMPDGDVNLSLTPLFAQLGDITIPSTIQILNNGILSPQDKNNKVSITSIQVLLLGAQKTANVTISKDRVSYTKVPSTGEDDMLDLAMVEDKTNSKWGLEKKNYNLIPNGEDFQLGIITDIHKAKNLKLVEFPQVNGENIKLEPGKRYNIKITQVTIPPVPTLEITPYSVLFNSYIAKDGTQPYGETERTLSYKINGGSIPNSGNIVSEDWVLEPYGGSDVEGFILNPGSIGVTSSQNNSIIPLATDKTPTTIQCKNLNANKAVKIILTVKDKFGRVIKDTISAYAGLLPGFAIADYNIDQAGTGFVENSPNTGSGKFTFDVANSKFPNSGVKINEKTYYHEHHHAMQGIFCCEIDKKYSIMPINFGQSIDNTWANDWEIKTYKGEDATGTNYIGTYWNFKEEGATYYDSYAIKIKKQGDNSKACAYKYKWVNYGQAGAYLQVSVYYLGEKANELLDADGKFMKDPTAMTKVQNWFGKEEATICPTRIIDFPAVGGKNNTDQNRMGAYWATNEEPLSHTAGFLTYFDSKTARTWAGDSGEDKYNSYKDNSYAVRLFCW